MAPPKKELAVARRRAAIEKWFDQSELARSMPSNAPEIVEALCDRMVETGESLAKICAEKTVPGAPALSMLYFWRKADPRINNAIMAARQARADSLWSRFEEELDAAFSAAAESGDRMLLMATTKKWELLLKVRKFEIQKLLPAIYGDAADKMAEGQGEGAKTFEEALAKAERDGKVVVQRILEIPAKAHAPPPKQAERRDDRRDRDLVVDIEVPAKGMPQ